MEKLVDKYGLYTSHLRNLVADTTKQRDCILLQGKFEILVEAKNLLQRLFFLILWVKPKKNFLMQKRDISIIDVLEPVETTKQSYKRLLKTLCKIKRML